MRTANRLAIAFLPVLAAAAIAANSACGSSSETPAAVATDAGSGSDAQALGGDRPVTLQVPTSYKKGTPMPLVIMLHGYTSTGDEEEAYLQFGPLAESRGFLYAHPNGLIDPIDHGYWNATDACCDLAGSKVDDSKYLNDLIDQITAQYSVDPKRVYFIGHSNGGFMSHRMACDHADKIAAIASLAGAQYQNPASCKPTATVSVLQIHGTSDQTIFYDGGAINSKAYPGAETTVKTWATLNGCSTTPDTTSPAIDIDSVKAGAETMVKKYATGCRPGGQVELWTITEGGHIPLFTPAFATGVIDFLFAHPKP